MRYSIPQPFPLQESILCHYKAFLGEQNLKHRIIKTYFSGIRYFQILQLMGNLFAEGAMPRLEYILAGYNHGTPRQPEYGFRLPWMSWSFFGRPGFRTPHSLMAQCCGQQHVWVPSDR